MHSSKAIPNTVDASREAAAVVAAFEAASPGAVADDALQAALQALAEASKAPDA